jgi:hypothetical protein
MCISWFTQPTGSFASCYLFNQSTHAFCRVRIELGRTARNGDNGDTLVSSHATRAVGFVPNGRDYHTSQLERWSINEAHHLCYDDEPLPQDPVVGYTVFDSTTPGDFVHRGNPITVTPHLPEGITREDMVMLARLVMAETTQGRIRLTARDASEAALRDAILEAIRVRR